MSSAEYLAWEARQEVRYEFDGVGPVAMNGGTVAHSRIQRNLMRALGNRLAGKACEPHGPTLKVATGDGRYRYPDAFVTCETLAGDADVAEAPVVVFEVLSETSAQRDRTAKLVEYRAIGSVRRYVMLEQDQVLVTVVARAAHGWSLDVLRAGEVLEMPEIGVSIGIDDIYADVAFAD